jgi:hypothetical protein
MFGAPEPIPADMVAIIRPLTTISSSAAMFKLPDTQAVFPASNVSE